MQVNIEALQDRFNQHAYETSNVYDELIGRINIEHIRDGCFNDLKAQWPRVKDTSDPLFIAMLALGPQVAQRAFVELEGADLRGRQMWSRLLTYLVDDEP